MPLGRAIEGGFFQGCLGPLASRSTLFNYLCRVTVLLVLLFLAVLLLFRWRPELRQGRLVRRAERQIVRWTSRLEDRVERFFMSYRNGTSIKHTYMYMHTCTSWILTFSRIRRTIQESTCGGVRILSLYLTYFYPCL